MTSLKNVRSVSEIDWSSLEYIGSGSWGSVFVKDTTNHRNRYAVKVGLIPEVEVDGLREANKAGLAVPVYAFFREVKLTDLPDKVRRQLPYKAARGVYVQVLVMGRARPLDTFDMGYWRKDRIVNNLAGRAYDAGLDWPDDHSGNVGRYRGRWIILDGLNYDGDLFPRSYNYNYWSGSTGTSLSSLRLW